MVLKTSSLTKQFGALTAVDEVSIHIEEGELRALIGPNGAGKTTLFNLITGLIKPSKGTISFRGEDITNLSVEKRVQRGISRSFQVTNIFPSLSVRENIRVAVQQQSAHRWNFWSDVDEITEMEDEVLDILEYVGMEIDPDTAASTLSHGEKRQLEIAIAIANDPDILLLDEPTAGMSKSETEEMITLIRELGKEHALLLVEHDIDLVLELSDRITVLHRGRVIAEGSPEKIVTNNDVQRAYLGTEVER
jgi:branched-chain amino acid transport system ATP-binding protein